MRKNSSRDSEATEIRHVFRQFCASFAGIKLTNNQPAQALFSCFSPSGFKYFRTLVTNVSATSFLGWSFLGKYMLGISNLKVLSALRGAHLTKKAVVFCLLW